MSFSQPAKWYRRLRNSLKNNNRRASDRRRRFRPLIEQLEGRQLMTNYIWTGAVDANWGSPGNWNTNDGTVPDDIADTVAINQAVNSPVLDQARAIGGMSGDGRLNLQSFSLTIDAASSSTFAGSISGTGGLIKQGAADFTLAATNSFTGPINVNAGNLIAENTAAYRFFRFVPTQFYSATPATFQLSEFQLTLNGAIQTGAIVTNPGGTGSGSLVQDGSLLNGLVDSNKAPLVWDFGSTRAIDQYRWATANTSDTSGFPIRWRFEGSNDGSTWRVLDDKSNGNYPTPTTAQTFLPSFHVANAIPDAAAVTVAGGTLRIGQGAETLGSLAGQGNVVIGDGGLAVAGNASTSFGGAITGTGGVTKNGTGVWTLGGANSYSGNTTLNAGTIRLDANEVIPDGAGQGNLFLNVGATLDLRGFSETVNGLAGGGTINSTTAGNSTISVGGNDQSSSFAGVIQNSAGAVGLTKVGLGSLSISGLNTYSGPTNVNEGTLQILGAPTAYRYFRFTPTLLRNSPGAANSVQLSEFQIFLGAGLLTGAVATNPGGSSPVGETPPMSVDNNLNTKWLDFNKGSLVLDYGSARSFDRYRWATANDAAERDAIRWKLEGSTNGSTWAMLDDKTTANYATPTARFTYLPLFSINGAPVGTSIPDNSTVYVAAAASLNLNNATETIGALSGSGNVLMGTGALTVNSAGNSTFSGLMTGSGNASLTKTGPGTLTIGSANSFPGGTTVNGGTLEIANASGSALGAGNVTVNSSGILAGTGSISGSVTVNSGGTVAPGASGVGKLTVGGVSFSPGASLDVDLNGAGAGQFDQLAVSTGAVNLNTVSLKPTIGYAAADGDTYRILDKLSAGAENGLVSNAVVSSSAFQVNQTGGDGNDLVLTYSSDAPTVANIGDSDADNSVSINEPITYAVTFSQDINHTTVSSADFNNAGTASVTFGAITETSPGVLTVVVTPTSAGTIILRIPAGATILDNAGAAVAGPVSDDDTITVQAPAPVAWGATSYTMSTIAGYMLGSQFAVANPITISHLGFFDGQQNGLTGSHPVGIWSVGGGLLAQTTVVPTDPLNNHFRYHALSTPLTIPTGTYVVGALYNSTEEYGYSPSGFTTYPGISFQGARYSSTSSFSFPGTFSSGFLGYFGADFLIGSANSPPNVASNSAAVTANEGGAASNSGTFSDPQGNGAVTLTASIGAVTKNDTLGTWSWSLNADDGPAGPFTVTITATDDAGAAAQSTFTFAIDNVPPTISLSGAAEIDEGSTYTLHLGAVTDPGRDSIQSYSINWGDGTVDTFGSTANPANPANTTATHTFVDGPATRLNKVTVTDEDGNFLAGELSVKVRNVAPTAAFSVQGNAPVTYGQTVTVSVGSLEDPSSADTTAGFRYAYSETGDFTGISYASGSTTAASHDYAGLDAGEYDFYVRIFDKDGGYSDYVQYVTVNKADATVTYGGYAGGTYDGNSHTQTVTVTGVGDDGILFTDSLSATNAGSYSKDWSFKNDNYNTSGESGTLEFSIYKAPSTTTVTLVGGPFTYTGAAQTPATVTVTGAGGLSLTPAADFANNTNAGTATASYNFAGDANHEASSDSKNFAIAKAPSTTTVTLVGGPFTYTGAAQTPATVTVTGAGGLSLTPAADFANNTDAGTATASYSFAGDANHEPSSDSKNFAIAKAPSTTTVTLVGGPFTYTGAAQTPATVTVTGVGGLSLTPAADFTNNTNAGTATASYSFAGDANHEASSDSKNFAIAKANQIITWADPSAINYGTPLSGTQLNATVAGVSGGSAPGALTYTPAAGTVLLAGTQTLIVTAAATTNYEAATKSVSLVVNPYLSSGFLAPISLNRAFKQGSTVPIKWILQDANGNMVTSLSAVTNLTVTGPGGTTTLYPGNSNSSGSTVLRHDGSQFIYNWQTKGFALGNYTIEAQLADGKSVTQTIMLSKSGAASALVIDGVKGVTAVGALLAGDMTVYVDNSNGAFSTDQLARIGDAVAGIESLVSPYGANIVLVDASVGRDANIVLDSGVTSVLGGKADGVLGVATSEGAITIIQGWNWYAGVATDAIAAGQYDFQTVVTHEIGHGLGLGHNLVTSSVMFPELGTADARRTLTVADLNTEGDDDDGAGLHVEAIFAAGFESSHAELESHAAPAGVPVPFSPYLDNFDATWDGATWDSLIGPTRNGGSTPRDGVRDAVLPREVMLSGFGAGPVLAEAEAGVGFFEREDASSSKAKKEEDLDAAWSADVDALFAQQQDLL